MGPLASHEEARAYWRAKKRESRARLRRGERRQTKRGPKRATKLLQSPFGQIAPLPVLLR